MSLSSVEDALISELKGVAGAYVREVKALPGDWDESIVKLIARRAPALYVVFVGGSRSRKTQGSQIDARWLVYAVTHHASGEEARRRGDSKVIGAYELLGLAIRALNGIVLPGEGTIELVSVNNLWSGQMERQSLAIYAAVFEVPTSVADVPTDEAALDAFMTFHADYDMAPNDGQIDAEDNVELEQ